MELVSYLVVAEKLELFGFDAGSKSRSLAERVSISESTRHFPMPVPVEVAERLVNAVRENPRTMSVRAYSADGTLVKEYDKRAEVFLPEKAGKAEKKKACKGDKLAKETATVVSNGQTARLPHHTETTICMGAGRTKMITYRGLHAVPFAHSDSKAVIFLRGHETISQDSEIVALDPIPVDKGLYTSAKSRGNAKYKEAVDKYAKYGVSEESAAAQGLLPDRDIYIKRLIADMVLRSTRFISGKIDKVTVTRSEALALQLAPKMETAARRSTQVCRVKKPSKITMMEGVISCHNYVAKFSNG